MIDSGSLSGTNIHTERPTGTGQEPAVNGVTIIPEGQRPHGEPIQSRPASTVSQVTNQLNALGVSRALHQAIVKADFPEIEQKIRQHADPNLLIHLDHDNQRVPKKTALMRLMGNSNWQCDNESEYFQVLTLLLQNNAHFAPSENISMVVARTTPEVLSKLIEYEAVQQQWDLGEVLFKLCNELSFYLLMKEGEIDHSERFPGLDIHIRGIIRKVSSVLELLSHPPRFNYDFTDTPPGNFTWSAFIDKINKHGRSGADIAAVMSQIRRIESTSELVDRYLTNQIETVFEK